MVIIWTLAMTLLAGAVTVFLAWDAIRHPYQPPTPFELLASEMRERNRRFRMMLFDMLTPELNRIAEEINQFIKSLMELYPEEYEHKV